MKEALRPDEIPIVSRVLADGRELVIWPLTCGRARVCLGEKMGSIFYIDEWDYLSVPAAIDGMMNWDPAKENEPTGWNRHHSTHRYRPEGDPTKEYIKTE